MKKIRKNKNFKPCEHDAGDEIFQNGIFHFNITKLIAYISKNSKDFNTEEVRISSLPDFSSSLDPVTIENANINNPIILAEISPKNFNIIDGNHRLKRARNLNKEAILAYKISADIHHKFLISTDAYDQYVHYWNEKVKTFQAAEKLGLSLNTKF